MLASSVRVCCKVISLESRQRIDVVTFGQLYDGSLGVLRRDELMGVGSSILRAAIGFVSEHCLQFFNFLPQLPEVILHPQQKIATIGTLTWHCAAPEEDDYITHS